MRLFWSKIADGTMAAPPNSTLTKEQVIANRRQFISRRGENPDEVTAMRLGKSGNDSLIRVMPSNHHTLDPDQAVQAEALIMDKPVKIFAVAADCPLVGLESQTHLAVVHCGWRGTAGLSVDADPADHLQPREGLAVQTVKKLREIEGDGTKITAAISPGICRRHYDVHWDVARLFAERYRNYVSSTGYSDDQGEKFLLDIPGIVIVQLLEAGLGHGDINTEGTRYCTLEDISLFSHRGAVHTSKPPGRMGVLVVTP